MSERNLLKRKHNIRVKTFTTIFSLKPMSGCSIYNTKNKNIERGNS